MTMGWTAADVVAAAEQVVHEANLANHTGQDNLCKCGHRSSSHYLSGLGRSGGCHICDSTGDGTHNHRLCSGYMWIPQKAVPEAHDRMPDDPQAEPGTTFDIDSTAMLCSCGHGWGEHDKAGHDCRGILNHDPDSLCTCVEFDSLDNYDAI